MTNYALKCRCKAISRITIKGNSLAAIAHTIPDVHAGRILCRTCGASLKIKAFRPSLRDELIPCTMRCRTAISADCTCSCGGDAHGELISDSVRHQLWSAA